VYISPSGSSKGAFQQLKGTVLDYCANIVASKLTRQEILTSFIQYLLPKIRYQPPLLLLSLSDCDKLMSPILTAILPKMHTNRNTSRAIVHGPEAFGGMALPHLHTIQGIDKLKLFLGHLRLKDRTAQLIHINLTCIELLTGTGDLFLNKEYSTYAWVEAGWVTSLWDFTSKINLTFSYPLAWSPPPPTETE